MAFMVVDNMPEAKLSDDSSQDHTYHWATISYY